jgi:hypothetical protein
VSAPFVVPAGSRVMIFLSRARYSSAYGVLESIRRSIPCAIVVRAVSEIGLHLPVRRWHAGSRVRANSHAGGTMTTWLARATPA